MLIAVNGELMIENLNTSLKYTINRHIAIQSIKKV